MREQLLAVTLEGVGGDRDDPRPLVGCQVLVEPVRGLDPVGARHVHVHEHDVELLGEHRTHGLVAVGHDHRPDAEATQHVACDLLVDLVVLGEEHPQVAHVAVRRRRGPGPRGLGPGGDERQADQEGRPLAEAALHLDRAREPLHDEAADRQAQARAAVLPAGGGVLLGEGLEEAVEVVGADAETGVADGQLQHGAVDPGERLVADACGQRDPARFGELHRVAEEVDHHLADPRLVAQHVGGDVGGQVQSEGDALAPRLGVEHADRVGEQVVEGDRTLLQLDATRLQRREVQDVVDQGQEQPAGGVGGADVLALVAVEVGEQQQVGQAEDGVERGADLVAHAGQEVGLLAGGLLGCVLGPAQEGLGAATLGDVALDRDEAGDGAVLVVQGIDLQEDPVRRAVRRVVEHLGAEGTPLTHGGPHQVDRGRVDVVVLEHRARRAAPDLGEAVAGTSLEGRVHPVDESLGVGDDHHVVRSSDDVRVLAQLGVEVTQGLGGALALTVEGRERHAEHRHQQGDRGDREQQAEHEVLGLVHHRLGLPVRLAGDRLAVVLPVGDQLVVGQLHLGQGLGQGVRGCARLARGAAQGGAEQGLEVLLPLPVQCLGTVQEVLGLQGLQLVRERALLDPLGDQGPLQPHGGTVERCLLQQQVQAEDLALDLGQGAHVAVDDRLGQLLLVAEHLGLVQHARGEHQHPGDQCGGDEAEQGEQQLLGARQPADTPSAYRLSLDPTAAHRVTRRRWWPAARSSGGRRRSGRGRSPPSGRRTGWGRSGRRSSARRRRARPA